MHRLHLVNLRLRLREVLVKIGNPLFIIEAMKLMNKINSDYDGMIIKILVSNEEPVEYGQTIMTIKTNR